MYAVWQYLFCAWTFEGVIFFTVGYEIIRCLTEIVISSVDFDRWFFCRKKLLKRKEKTLRAHKSEVRMNREQSAREKSWSQHTLKQTNTDKCTGEKRRQKNKQLLIVEHNENWIKRLGHNNNNALCLLSLIIINVFIWVTNFINNHLEMIISSTYQHIFTPRRLKNAYY